MCLRTYLYLAAKKIGIGVVFLSSSSSCLYVTDAQLYS